MFTRLPIVIASLYLSVSSIMASGQIYGVQYIERNKLGLIFFTITQAYNGAFCEIFALSSYNGNKKSSHVYSGAPKGG